MEVKILEDRYNPLLCRREIRFLVEHRGRSTPVKFEVRKYLAAMLNTDLNLVYIIRFATKTSTNLSEGLCHVYDSKDYVERLVPGFIRRKNEPKQAGGG
ncbi:MAG: 30S ribosomal protein S24e [Candidatus Bathyarchaeota archaeon]|nr:30S ribosomal protein S24e [Candidatus Bathyarchaeota archaeon]